MILFQLSHLFSSTQITILILILVVVILSIIVNLWICFHYKRNRKYMLCTKQLQKKKEELLARIELLKTNPLVGPYKMTDYEEEEVSMDDREAKEEPFDPYHQLQVMRVKDMSLLMREHFQLTSSIFDEKSYYVRYSYSFEAKLRDSKEKLKEIYADLCKEISNYKGIGLKMSFKHVRIYKGLKTLGFLHFRGKTLCIALALDPNDYKDTKYKSEDLSHIKRYTATPLLLRLTSRAKLEYAKYLLLQLASKYHIPLTENPVTPTQDLSCLSISELFEKKLLQITLYAQVEDNKA